VHTLLTVVFKDLLLPAEIVNIVAALTVKAYATFLVRITTSLVSLFCALTLALQLFFSWLKLSLKVPA
jgi:preprotein translocase subunit SecG